MTSTGKNSYIREGLMDSLYDKGTNQIYHINNAYKSANVRNLHGCLKVVAGIDNWLDLHSLRELDSCLAVGPVCVDTHKSTDSFFDFWHIHIFVQVVRDILCLFPFTIFFCTLYFSLIKDTFHLRKTQH
jgi:hypothetical protein